MRSIRTASVALLTAGALALTVTPAMAQSSASSEVTISSGSSASSDIGAALNATDEEKAIWGSTKNFGEASEFGVLWYAYTLAVTAAAIAGGVNAAYPAIQQTAAQFGIKI